MFFVFVDFLKNLINKQKKIIIELDERYFDKKSLMDAVVKQLTNQGKICEVVGVDLLLIDGKKYYLSERNVVAKYCPPVQQVVLIEVD